MESPYKTIQKVIDIHSIFSGSEVSINVYGNDTGDYNIDPIDVRGKIVTVRIHCKARLITPMIRSSLCGGLWLYGETGPNKDENATVLVDNRKYDPSLTTPKVAPVQSIYNSIVVIHKVDLTVWAYSNSALYATEKSSLRTTTQATLVLWTDHTSTISASRGSILSVDGPSLKLGIATKSTDQNYLVYATDGSLTRVNTLTGQYYDRACIVASGGSDVRIGYCSATYQSSGSALSVICNGASLVQRGANIIQN